MVPIHPAAANAVLLDEVFEISQEIVGEIFPERDDGLLAANFVEVFEKFAISGDEFCAGNHVLIL